MPLHRLIYSSRVRDDFNLEAFRQIGDVSAAQNRQRNLTGCLLYCKGYFVQLLEGEPQPLNACYNAITRDPRHEGLYLIDYRRVLCRNFADWDMRVLYYPDDDMPPLYKRYSGLPGFDPVNLDGEAWALFLAELCASD